MARPQNAGKFGLSTFIIAVILVGLPLGVYNSLYVVTHNISAIRYMPVVILLLILLFSPAKTGIFFTISSLLIATIAMALFPEFGVFCLFALILFLVSQKRFSMRTIWLSLLYIGFSLTVYFAFSLATRELLGIAAHEFLVEKMTRFSQNLGGLKIFWDPLSYSLLFSNFFVLFFYLYTLVQRPLRYMEGVAFSLAGCSILSFAYYLNRPYESYWIFIALWIPVAHVIFNDLYNRVLINLKTSTKKVKAGKTEVDGQLGVKRLRGLHNLKINEKGITIHLPHLYIPILIFLVLYISVFIGSIDTTFEVGVKNPWRNIDKVNSGELLGIKTQKKFANEFNVRLSELKKISKDSRDSLIFTTTPFAAMVVDVSERLPQEIIFRNNNQRELNQTVKKVLKESPAQIIFDHNWNHGYRFEVAIAVISRIKNAISLQYQLEFKTRYWEVWQKRSGVEK